VSARIQPIHRIVLAVQIRFLGQVGIAGCERAGLGMVETATDFRQSGVAVVAVAGCGGEAVDAASRTRAGDGIAEAFGCER